MISTKELQRYEKQLSLKNWDKQTQQVLKEKHVFIAGIGGLGSVVAYYLAGAGIGTLTLCDSDKVELSNLNRQIIHQENKIGQYKTNSASEKLHMFNPNISINRITDTISNKNIKIFLSQIDLVIDCLDNYSTRYVINNACHNMNLPLIHGGAEEFNGQITFIQTPKTPCLACFLPKRDKKKSFSIVGATAGIIGSLQALEAIKYFTGIGSILTNKLLFWDGQITSLKQITIKKNPHCKICS